MKKDYRTSLLQNSLKVIIKKDFWFHSFTKLSHTDIYNMLNGFVNVMPTLTVT